MSKYSVIIKKSLLLIVFVVILMPIAQNNLSLFLVKDLKGSFQKTAKIDFSFDYWYDGVFQETCEKFLNENLYEKTNLNKILNNPNIIKIGQDLNGDYNLLKKIDEVFYFQINIIIINNNIILIIIIRKKILTVGMVLLKLMT